MSTKWEGRPVLHGPTVTGPEVTSGMGTHHVRNFLMAGSSLPTPSNSSRGS